MSLRVAFTLLIRSSDWLFGARLRRDETDIYGSCQRVTWLHDTQLRPMYTCGSCHPYWNLSRLNVVYEGYLTWGE